VKDLVLAMRQPTIMKNKSGGKFQSRWDGPYNVKEVYTYGAYLIVDNYDHQVGPVDGRFLREYYA